MVKRKNNDDAQDLNFEDALTSLEDIVKVLEKGDLPLEESLAKFAEGVKLSQTCLKKLNAAEQQVDKIIQEIHGEIIEKSFIIQEDEPC